MAADDKRSLRDDAVSALARLQAACAANTPVSLLPAHMSLPCAGRLHSATVDGVLIEVENPPRLDFSLVGCAAAVRFPVGQQVAGFVEPITARESLPSGGLRVTVALPKRLHFDERRSAVRIPVPRDTLRATVLDDDDRRPIVPVDISLTGILIEVDATRRDAIGLGQSLSLELSLGEETLRIEAVVCRRDRDRLGLRYATEETKVPGLARIIYDLQAPLRPRR